MKNIKLLETEDRKVVARAGGWEKQGEFGKRDLMQNMVSIVDNTVLYN